MQSSEMGDGDDDNNDVGDFNHKEKTPRVLVNSLSLFLSACALFPLYLSRSLFASCSLLCNSASCCGIANRDRLMMQQKNSSLARLLLAGLGVEMVIAN